MEGMAMAKASSAASISPIRRRAHKVMWEEWLPILRLHPKPLITLECRTSK